MHREQPAATDAFNMLFRSVESRALNKKLLNVVL